MTLSLVRGRHRVRLADSTADIVAAQSLRHRAFVDGPGLPPRRDRRDQDRFDAECDHLLVEDVLTGRLAGCARLRLFASGAGIGHSYAAQFYGLERLSAFPGPMAEVGRFCAVHEPAGAEADVLRLAWAGLTQLVDAARIEFLFGCSSFAGTDGAPYAAAFHLLAQDHLAPVGWAPSIKAPRVVRFDLTPRPEIDRRRGLAALPPLLRSYLAMGGRVSDHAVVDRQLHTLHVFTGVEIARVPASRVRALRQVAGATALAPAVSSV